jgi:hypothetical protein
MRILFLLCVLGLFSCSQSDQNKHELNTDKKEVTLTELEVSDILTNWKKDSLGCLGLRRNPEKMNLLTRQLGLIGKDSVTILKILGEPNGKYGQGTNRHFLYFAECGDGKTSYANYYCHFSRDTVRSFSFVTF